MGIVYLGSMVKVPFLLDNWKYLILGGFQVHGNEREKRLLLPGR